MKWFKHYSQLTRDEGVSLYFENHKVSGYGFLMLVLEAVAERMEYEGERCAATYSRAEWARLTRASARSVDKYMHGLENIEWIQVTLENGRYTVDVPKMVDWRDEYSRKKAGQTPDIIRTMSHREERDQIKSKIDKRQSFEDIKRKVNSVMTQQLAEPSDISRISKLTGSSPKQAREAIHQLLESHRIGKKW